MKLGRGEAEEMRRAGMSYKKISYALKIPVSTLSDWFGSEEWSQKIRAQLGAVEVERGRVRMRELNAIRGKDLAQTYQDAREEAQKELLVLKYHPVFVAGVMLYWGEGDKVSKNSVRVSNVDPVLLKVFVCFLTEVCGIPRDDIRASVLVYPDLDEAACRIYWSEGIGLPIEQFRKSTVIRGRHKARKLGYGVCIVYISRAYLKRKMLEWIQLLPRELLKGDYYAKM